jgi:hypothetical protein
VTTSILRPNFRGKTDNADYRPNRFTPLRKGMAWQQLIASNGL